MLKLIMQCWGKASFRAKPDMLCALKWVRSPKNYMRTTTTRESLLLHYRNGGHQFIVMSLQYGSQLGLLVNSCRVLVESLIPKP